MIIVVPSAHHWQQVHELASYAARGVKKTLPQARRGEEREGTSMDFGLSISQP